MKKNDIRSFFQILVVVSVLFTYSLPSKGQTIDFGGVYDTYRFCNLPLRELKNKDVTSMLKQLHNQYAPVFSYEQSGASVQGRPIYLVKLGTGSTHILLWSQMHGDEPTATASLFDVFNFLMMNRDRSPAREILRNTTILAVPMLNPDGAEIFKRRNAQGLDINRDARDLQSPEGRILFDLKERYKPVFGFNLHDQNARRTVGKSNKLAAVALMAPPFDYTDNDNEVRLRAKQIVSVIHKALGPYLYGHISKYDADYMPRAFGDAMQNWGVSTVLIESGGWYQNRDDFLQKMNFIALLKSFSAIATGAYNSANPAVYDILQQNDKNIYDLLIRDAVVIDGTGIPPFKTDIGINYDENGAGKIADTGDLDIFAAKDTINASNMFITPGLIGVMKKFDVNDQNLPTSVNQQLQNGYTTLLLPLRTDPVDAMTVLRRIIETNNIAVNLGTLLFLYQMATATENAIIKLKEIIPYMMGFCVSEEDSNKYPALFFTAEPVITTNEISYTAKTLSLDPGDIKKLTLDQAIQWEVPARGKIRHGQYADLIFFLQNDTADPVVQRVLLKGHTVCLNGNLIETPIRGDFWFAEKK